MHFFEKRVPGKQSYNLHLIPYRSDCWYMRIAFRDYLRSHREVAQDYAALKRRLAGSFPFDRTGYGEGKSPFIRRIAARARRSSHSDPQGATGSAERIK